MITGINMHIRIILAVALFGGLLTIDGFGQSPEGRFEAAIRQFEAADAREGYKPEAVLFTGSSSIRMWSGLAEDMKPMPVLNRGFGGSTIPEVLEYADRIIKPHDPKMVVLYCGDNDLANDTTTAQNLLQSFIDFDRWFEKNLPGARLYFISIKPSVKRWHHWEKMHEANHLIADYMQNKQHLRFVDVSTDMLDKKGEVIPSLFIEDGLHLNEKGYRKWAKTLKPTLEQMYKLLY
jgi:lysophospholipase L1-like esterase